MTIRFDIWPKSQIAARQHDIVTLYREAFTPPPYNEPEVEIMDFAQSLLTQLDREGYRFVAAIDDASGQLAGFAYGYAIRAARWWCDAVRPALSAELAAAWLENSYQFVELAVAPHFQGQGIGGRLHDDFL